MNRIDAILNNSQYKKHMSNIAEAEKNREFCLHGLQHSIDVARVAYIINLEEGFKYKQDVIYGMALLHDIGRSSEYESGIGHHEAGARLAGEILRECGYDKDECKAMTDAIASHKNPVRERTDLRYILYKADKLTRNCFECPASKLCYWSEDIKNKTLTY